MNYPPNYVTPVPFASKSGGSLMSPQLLWERRPWPEISQLTTLVDADEYCSSLYMRNVMMYYSGCSRDSETALERVNKDRQISVGLCALGTCVRQHSTAD